MVLHPIENDSIGPYKRSNAHSLPFRVKGYRHRESDFGIRNSKSNRKLSYDLVTENIRDYLDKNASSWDFDIFHFNELTEGQPLLNLSLYVLENHGLIEEFSLDFEKLYTSLVAIEDHYRVKNPYHNAVHAADVTQATHCFLLQPKIARWIRPIEKLAVLLGSAGHDVDHPGVNQAFLVQAYAQLKARAVTRGESVTTDQGKPRFLGESLLLYLARLRQYETCGKSPSHAGDTDYVTSVLETHHLHQTLCVLRASGFLGLLNPRDRKIFTELMRDVILSTDMSQHSLMKEEFQRRNSHDSQDSAVTPTESRTFTLKMIIKAADICNPGKNWSLCHTWAHRVCEEFYLMGDTERKLGLRPQFDSTVSPIPLVQSNFVKFCVVDFFREWNIFLQSDLSERICLNVENNLKLWEGFNARLKDNKNVSEGKEESKYPGYRFICCATAKNIENPVTSWRQNIRGNRSDILKKEKQRDEVPLVRNAFDPCVNESLNTLLLNERINIDSSCENKTIQKVNNFNVTQGMLKSSNGFIPPFDLERFLPRRCSVPVTDIEFNDMRCHVSPMRRIQENIHPQV